MLDYTIKIDTSRLQARFGKIIRSMRLELSQEVQSLGIHVLGRIQRMLSGERLQVRSGRLLRAWHLVYETMLRVRIAVDRRVRYAGIHEFGGTIVPRRGMYLHFQVDGRWIRTTRVTLPARYYVRDSVADVRRTVGTRMSGAVRKALS